ncbi:MAG: hypothetical protein WCG80_17220 [Spirochaetales bacterium]
MTARTQVLTAIEKLGPRELLRVADFIDGLGVVDPHEMVPTIRGADYRAVRGVLSGLGVSMAQEVERGREDRS